jgi:O-antigen ligase
MMVLIERLNKYSNYSFKILLLLIIVFISSDVFLAIELSGATIRFSYILFLLLFILWIIYLVFNRGTRIPLDRSYIPLFLFCFISAISSLNSVFPLKSLIYALWTVFSALTIVFLVWFSRNNGLFNLNWLLKVYFYSYMAIAIFGLYQILLPFIIGKKTPFIDQWWIKPTFARINGLSYEPSFFASYMLMGCFIWFIMWIRDNDFIKNRGIILSTIGVVLFLSSSRIGWIGIMVIIAYGLVEFFGFFFINKKFTKQNFKFFIYFICGVLFATAAVIYIIYNPERFDFIFTGTGLFDTSDASFSLRFERSVQTLKVFTDRLSNTIFGVGPGGVGAYMVTYPEKYGILASSFETLWATEPNTVFIELLASVGVIGFIFFSWFIVNIFKRLWDLYKNKVMARKYRTICLAMFWGLVIELLILQFNQNYLRPYLWLHIGISVALVNTLEYLLQNRWENVLDEKAR